MTDRDSNKPLATSRRHFLKQSIALAGAVSGIAALGLSAPASLRSAAWAEGLVEVRASTPVKYTVDAITLEGRGLAGEILPALDDHVAVARIEFHQVRHAAVFLCRDRGGAGACKAVEDDVAALGIVEQLILEDRNRLHRRMLAVARRLVEFHDGRLLAIIGPQMGGAVFPTIEARFMLPMKILPSHDLR